MRAKPLIDSGHRRCLAFNQETTMTKIAFEDFERQVVQHHLIKGNVYENGAALVARANVWIAEHGIDVLNVESLSTFGAGDDTSVSHWYSGIRVWYRTE
jgi:hypothetical protein